MSVVPIHKKDDKRLIENYRQVSLLQICVKVFERLIFTGDSCVQQLISITHKIYIMLLTVTLLLKYEMCFWIFPKRLIRYGIKG